MKEEFDGIQKTGETKVFSSEGGMVCTGHLVFTTTWLYIHRFELFTESRSTDGVVAAVTSTHEGL